jgi:hypothetical protein
VAVGQGGSVDFLLGSSVVGGLPTIGENLVVNVLSKRPWVKNRVANHKVIEGDTFNTIIGSLVDQVNALGVPNLTALADDPMDHVGITLSLATSVGPSDCMDEQIEIRAGAGDVQMVMEVKRQQKIFWVNIWAPSPTLRQLFTDALDATFGLFENTTVSVDGQPNVILLPDGSMGLAYYNSSWPSDEEQIEKVWRQTFALSVEYPTLQVVGGTEIVALEIEGEVLQPPSQSGWGRPEVRQPPLLFKGMVMTDVLHELRKLTVGYDDNQP